MRGVRAWSGVIELVQFLFPNAQLGTPFHPEVISSNREEWAYTVPNHVGEHLSIGSRLANRGKRVFEVCDVDRMRIFVSG